MSTARSVIDGGVVDASGSVVDVAGVVVEVGAGAVVVDEDVTVGGTVVDGLGARLTGRGRGGPDDLARPSRGFDRDDGRDHRHQHETGHAERECGSPRHSPLDSPQGSPHRLPPSRPGVYSCRCLTKVWFRHVDIRVTTCRSTHRGGPVDRVRQLGTAHSAAHQIRVLR